MCIFEKENNFVFNSERGTSIFVDNDLLDYKLSCCGSFSLFFSFAQNAFDPTVPGLVSMPIAYAILYIQVNLFQKLLFLHQLTLNMTT